MREKIKAVMKVKGQYKEFDLLQRYMMLQMCYVM